MNTLDSLSSCFDSLEAETLHITAGMLPIRYFFCRLFPEYCYPML